MKSEYRRAFSLTSIYLAASAAERALGLLLLPLYTLFLSPADFGLMALLTLTANLAVLFVAAPLSSALMRFYYQPEFQERRGELLSSLVLLGLTKSLGVALVWLAASEPLCRLLLDDLRWLPLVRAFGAIVLLDGVSMLFSTHLQLRERAAHLAFVQLTSLVLTVAITLGLLAIFDLGVAALVYGRVFSLVYRTALTAPAYLRECAWSPSLAVLREPLRFGYPFLVAGYSNLLMQAGDRYVLRVFTGLSEIGLYNVGAMFASIVVLLLVEPSSKSFQPLLLQQEDRPDELRTFVRRFASLYYAIGMLLVLATSLLARELIALFTSQAAFEPAWVVVPILAFSALQQGLGAFLGAGIVMSRRSVHFSALLLFSAAVNIGLNFLLIPVLGILGAALATLVAYLVWNVLRVYFSATLYAVRFDLTRIFGITLLGGALCALGLWLGAWAGLWLGLAIKAAAILAYLPLALVTGLVQPDERKLALGLLRDARARGLIGSLKALLGGETRR